ncbi:restriction endonuclease [Psychrobacillus soli]|uniref:Restriction endonuclease n=1 Tax=Psychrobacillus soli TaxID=1543965 RepID=A0A544TBA0_9BACI|nr:restriction endonuclease [Psychrobacillus soli]TQR14744.1 restriction endonuclease [Psychrobacillus soli]
MGQKAKKQHRTNQFNTSSILFIIILFIIGLETAGSIKPLQDDATTTTGLLIFLFAINIGLFRSMELHKAFQHTHRIQYWKFKQKSIFCLYLFFTVLTIAEIVPYGWVLTISFVLGLIYIGIRSVSTKKCNIGLPSLPIKNHSKQLQIDIEEIDKMDGKQFEVYLAELYDGMGYYTEVTPHTDYGVDVIVIKDKVKAGIQAKCYGEGRTVGVDAVNEVCGGAGYWNVHKKLIITNRYFTEKALISAQHNEIEMIDRNGLMLLIREYQELRIQKGSSTFLTFLTKFKHN